MMPLTAQQIAIKCSYEGRRKPPKPPRDRMVLDGKVKLTPRRREILFHVACTDSIWWRVERDWASGWKGGKVFRPYLGATSIWLIAQYLRRRTLIRYAPGTPLPVMGGTTKEQPVFLITARGMDALLETVTL